MISRAIPRHGLRALVVMTALLSVGAATRAHALVADLGSDGSDGPLNITVDTVLPLPPDGVIHASTVTIATGATLSFSFPGATHPGVILLATGDVVIDGAIDVSGGASVAGTMGAAGPGGTTGGRSASGTSTAYSGLGTVLLLPSVSGVSVGIRPTGGAGGQGSWCRDSGATGGAGGGGGGGSIVIASNTRISGVGTVTAAGGAGGSAQPTPCAASRSFSALHGEDGRIRLMTPIADLTGATLVAAEARLDAGHVLGAPSVIPGPEATVATQGLRLGGELARVSPPLPTPMIVAVDGAPVAPGSTVMLPAASPGATITVHVDDCTRGPMTVGVLTSRQAGQGCLLEETVVAAPTGSDDVDVSFSFCSSTIDAAVLTPTVFCGPASVP